MSWSLLGDALRTAQTDEPWFRETDATKAYEAAVDAGLEPEPCGLLALRPRPVPASIAGCYEQRADVFGRGSHAGVLQLFEAAKWHTRGGDFKKATRNLLRVKKALPRDPELWVQFGLARRGAGKLAPAVEAYERAVELDPACVEAYQNWGNLELGRENRPRALELFRRELELDPSHRSRFENYASDPDIQALLKGEPFTERPVPPPVRQPPADPPDSLGRKASLSLNYVVPCGLSLQLSGDGGAAAISAQLPHSGPLPWRQVALPCFFVGVGADGSGRRRAPPATGSARRRRCRPRTRRRPPALPRPRLLPRSSTARAASRCGRRPPPAPTPSAPRRAPFLRYRRFERRLALALVIGILAGEGLAGRHRGGLGHVARAARRGLRGRRRGWDVERGFVGFVDHRRHRC